MRNKILSIALILAVAVSVVGIVAAYSGSAGVVIENAEEVFVQPNGDAGVGMFGASGDSNFTNVVADGDITAGDDLTVAGLLDVEAMTWGGSTDTVATTAQGVLTLTASNVCDNGYLSITAGTNVGAYALTMPATSTLFADCLSETGASKSLVFFNNQSLGNATVTKAGTIVLLEEDGGNVVVDTGDYVRFTFIRTGTQDLVVLAEELQDAD